MKGKPIEKELKFGKREYAKFIDRMVVAMLKGGLDPEQKPLYVMANSLWIDRIERLDIFDEENGDEE